VKREAEEDCEPVTKNRPPKGKGGQVSEFR
jgi:hypothetical protein